MLVVGSEGEVPHALSDEEVLCYLVGRGIHHGDAVGWTECHESELVVAGKLDVLRLDLVAAQAAHLERELVLYQMALGIDNADCAAEFGRNPYFGAVMPEGRIARPRVYQDRGHHPPR